MTPASLALAEKLLHRDPKIFAVHAVDNGVALGVELLLDRGRRRTVDQRFGGGKARGGILRKAQRQFAGGGFQLDRGDDLDDQSPVVSLLCGKAVFGEENLQRAADADS